MKRDFHPLQRNIRTCSSLSMSTYTHYINPKTLCWMYLTNMLYTYVKLNLGYVNIPSHNRRKSHNILNQLDSDFFKCQDTYYYYIQLYIIIMTSDTFGGMWKC